VKIILDRKMNKTTMNKTTWEIKTYKDQKKLKLKSPILIEGMPGIGNVGKISMDMLIEETRAELIMSFHSYKMPNSVFVNEKNLVDLPKISLHHKKIRGQDYIFLTGDVQPIDEESSYEFCEMIIHLFKEMKGKFIITLGGIGLSDVPENPEVYITGNNEKFLKDVTLQLSKKKLKYNKNIYGKVGPIMGVSGVLLGLSKNFDVLAYSLLAETFGHPLFVGLKGSRAILHILNKNYSLDMNMARLDKEIKHMEQKPEDKSMAKYKNSETSYIG
jgi:proteasome assembly chaperone (PAC2) family protein